jgi:hypothetical protein
MKARQVWKAIQTQLGTAIDGIPGPNDENALARLQSAAKANLEWPQRPEDTVWHEVKASSFADPADIRAFKKCKAQGKSDQECFKVGDNGIGKWGDDTTVDRPMCALPPDDWEQFSNPRGKLVRVVCGGLEVVCELRDTMPRKKNIKNGAGIDLNQAAWKALGKTPPVMEKANWSWV